MDKEGLYQIWMEPNEVLFARIDECGGWPWNAKSIVMKHTGCGGPRPCYFSTAENIRNEWNTSVATADEYYFWKLSDKAKEKLKSELIRDFKVKVANLVVE